MNIRRIQTLTLACLLLPLAAVGTSAGGPDTGHGPAVFNVGFFADPPVGVGDDLHGGRVTAINDAIDFVTVRADDGFPGRAGGDGRIRYIERDIPMTAFYTPNDPSFGQQWDFQTAFPAMDAVTAWDTTLGSSSVKVAVLDTGIDTDHPDLPSPVLAQDFTGSGTYEDCDGHGTHVAGTVSALTGNGIGVAGTSQSSLYTGRVLACGGSGDFSWLANGITWAVDNGADIISMSLGCSFHGCFHQATSDALAYAVANDVLTVCAAGNSGPKKNSVEFPGNDPNCMAVSNVGNGFLSSSSSTGPEVEIAAQGTDILSTWIGGGYNSISGTSMATPHVAGVAALVKAVNPSLGGQDLRDVLKASAIDSSLDANQEGSGILNAAAAVALAPTWTSGGSGGGGGGGSTGFDLTATGYKVQGKQNVDLAWTGGAGGGIDVYRDGGLIATTTDTGAYTDAIGAKGGATYVYQVCDAGTSTCSNEATVVF